MEQFYRLGPAQTPEVLAQGQQEQEPEQEGGFPNTLRGNLHAELGRNTGQLQKQQNNGLGKQDTQQDAPR